MALSPEQEKRLEYLDSLFKEREAAEMDEYPFYDSVEGLREDLKTYYRSFPGVTEKELEEYRFEWGLLRAMKD